MVYCTFAHKSGIGTAILLQADAGVDDDETATSELAAAREQFARPSKKRQQQIMTVQGNDRTKQFDPGGRWSTPFLFRCNVCPHVLFSSVFLFSCFSSCLQNFPKQVQEAKRFFD